LLPPSLAFDAPVARAFFRLRGSPRIERGVGLAQPSEVRDLARDLHADAHGPARRGPASVDPAAGLFRP
jgi:hypothetical protein